MKAGKIVTQGIEARLFDKLIQFSVTLGFLVGFEVLKGGEKNYPTKISHKVSFIRRVAEKKAA